MKICPKPHRWHDIYEELRQVCSERRIESLPPVPFILNGWIATNDVEKAERWAATVQWATEHGVANLVQFAADDWYAVEKPSSHLVGPEGGPMLLPWRFEPAEKPSDEAAHAALALLVEQWPRIAGELAPHTKPVAITGEKMRRLVVAVSGTSPRPPWGNWDRLAEDESRRAFTQFRRAINSVVAPLEIDHIDFHTGRAAAAPK